MKYFPAFIDLSKHSVVIVGGGNVAQRKLEVLLKFSTDITLISPEFGDGIQSLIAQYHLTAIHKRYASDLVANASLIVAATDDEKINQQIHDDAKQSQQLLNVVDQPDLCDYITPAIIDRDPICIALSSGGKSPVLLRILRSQLESFLPHNLGQIAEFCDSKREEIKANFTDLDDRRYFWDRFFQQLTISPTNNEAELQQLFDSLIKQTKQPNSICYFFDCNSRELDDLNLRAVKRMQAVDLLVFGENVPKPYVEFVRRDAEKISEHDINDHISLIESSQIVIGLNLSLATKQKLSAIHPKCCLTATQCILSNCV